MGSVASVCFENMALPVGAWFLFILFATISPMGRRRVRIRIRRRERGAVSPAVAFAVLVVVLAAALIGFALLEKDDEDGRPAPSPAGTVPTDEEDQSLTDAEAVARLSELEQVRIRALEEQDPSLLENAFTPDGPATRRIERSIKQLKKDGVRLTHRSYEVLSTEVLSSSSESIRIRRVVEVNIQFTDASGERVTAGSGAERQVLIATLKRVADEWLFHDGDIVETIPLSS